MISEYPLIYRVCEPESPVSAALESVLKTLLNGSIAEHPANASLVILHDLDGLFLAPDVLRFYHEGLGGRAKRLIYIEGPDSNPSQNADPDWLFRLRAPGSLVPQLIEWLDSPWDEISDLPHPPEPAACRALIAQLLGASSPKDLREHLPDIAPQVFDSDHAIAFYQALCRICPNYSNLVHVAHRVSDTRLFGSSNTERSALKSEREWRFLQTCEDLRKSLITRVRHESSAQNVILVIDDNPREYQVGLAKIIETFLSDFEFWTCELNAKQQDFIRFVTGYRSGERPGREVQGRLLNATINRIYPSSETSSLADILPRLRFILMDQLFRTDGGYGELQGPALTSGISRILRDELPNRKGVGPTPEIIAISRNDDPEVIQHALRAGAKDYVLKSHLLTLPSVLGRLQRAVSDPPRNLHRNFRALYRLPSETIGLLQALTIPPLPLHRIPEVDPLLVDTDLAIRSRIADLLTTLPKPDLHVHVGSCMSTEFLVVASLVGLLRHTWEHLQRRGGLSPVASTFASLLAGGHRLELMPALSPANGVANVVEVTKGGAEWIASLARLTKDQIRSALFATESRTRYPEFRAILHASLGIADFLTKEAAAEKVGSKADLEVALFAIRHSVGIDPAWEAGDLVRVYLLKLASLYSDPEGRPPALDFEGCDFLRLFVQPTQPDTTFESWNVAHAFFYSRDSTGPTITAFREAGWRWNRSLDKLRLHWPHRVTPPDFIAGPIRFETQPIEYELASGLRSSNLQEYLQGCEFSGAEHLRHPFLIHLYAQQTVLNFVRKGVFYAELKGSPDGYVAESFGFEFSHACACLVQAFSQAQEVALRAYQRSTYTKGSGLAAQPLPDSWIAGVLGEEYEYARLAEMFSHALLATPRADAAIGPASGHNSLGNSHAGRHLPCKVSLVFVGKRHKRTSELILEAAAAAVMRPSGDVPTASARDFVETEMRRCRVVGFDLAGQEVGYPPESFAQEFARLSRLHIPLTIHAGENAPARFIEDAVLLLRAKRIGHGLALAEDKGLMTRLREDRICIELCPVCNHQTSHFTPTGQDGGRQYPLKRFLEHGLYVTINTDNPVISNTNLVKEYFQASYAYDQKGLSIWDALRLMRMGYVCSFLHLPERRAMIEMVEQYLTDLFSQETVVDYLRELAELQRQKQPSTNHLSLAETAEGQSK